MLASFKFEEPNGPGNDDQRPLVRYLRHLRRTNPGACHDAQAVQLSIQGSSRPTEAAYCNPFFWMGEMKTNESYGRHFVADQDVDQAGAILGGEHPIVYVTQSRDTCAECDRKLPTPTGVRCKNHTSAQEDCPLAFCSTICRDSAWEHYHKKQDHQVMGTYYSRNRGGPHFLTLLLILKVLSMKELPVANRYALSYVDAFLENPHLLSHTEGAQLLGRGFDMIKGASGFTKTDDIDDLVGKLFALNSLYAFGTDETKYLFGPLCCVNHSCEANVTISGLDFHETDAVKPFVMMKSLRPIKKGEQLFYDYRGASMTPRSTCKANIKAQYGFECQCRLCNDGIPRCDYEGCMAENHNLKRCQKCKNAVYCNRTCQVKDWKHHKKYCGLKASGVHT